MAAFRTSFVALLAAIALAAPAYAQDAGSNASDARCIIALTAAIEATKNDTMQAALPVAFAFYIGRIQGRDPKADLESLLLAEYKADQSKDLRPDMRRCGAEMQGVSVMTAQLAQDFRGVATGSKAP